MRDLEVVDNVRYDENLRESFFEYVDAVFPGFAFRKWYEMGFWADEYNPHAVVQDDRVVSVVAASRMSIVLNGKDISGVQIGTVGTLPGYRGRGISRRLMEYVLDKYSDSTDLCFLYADEDVLDFYPKFGFRRFDESVFIATSNIPEAAFSARKLSVDNPDDLALLISIIEERMDITRIFGARDYGFITLWHMVNIYPDNLYYIDEDDVVFILTEKERNLNIREVIYRKQFDIVDLLPKIMKSSSIDRIRYYFPPDQIYFEYDETESDIAMPLFVRGEFPLENGLFKLPTTAHT